MPYMIDARWLLILPLGSIVVFVSWVLWNLSREIWIAKRRRVRRYRTSEIKIYIPESTTEGRTRSRYHTLNRDYGFSSAGLPGRSMASPRHRLSPR